MTIATHEVSVVVGDRHIPGWKEYSISTDMLKPADAFNMRVRFTRKAWQLLTPDEEITVYLDDTRILSGFIDVRRKRPDRGSGTNIQIEGRDRSGRLVDESSPLFSYGGLALKDLAEKIVGVKDANPLFQEVILDNAPNRRLLRNRRSRQSRNVREPGGLQAALAVTGSAVAGAAGGFILTPRVVGTIIETGRKKKQGPSVEPGIFGGRSAPKKVSPGTSRWAVLEQFINEARLIAWSTADGKSLYIGLPNYEQEPQYKFFEASQDSANRDQTNCTIEVANSIADRYSKYTVVGAARGSGSSYGPNVTKNRGVALDNTEDSDGVGINFARRKELIIADDGVRSAREALERAEREQFERDASGIEITIDAPGHSQVFAGETPTLFAIDTMAKVQDEDTELDDDMLITSCEYRRSRREGTRTTMMAVPRGTFLQL